MGVLGTAYTMLLCRHDHRGEHPLDEVKNPITVCRKQLNKTGKLFAKEAQVHEQALLINERGCYTEILPGVLDYLVDRGYDELSLQTDYKNYVRFTRHVSSEKYQFELFDLGSPKVNKSCIFEVYEHCNLPRTQFAKQVCIQPALLYRIEKGELKSLPSQIELAFREIKIRSHVLEKINERQEEFHDFIWL